MLSCSKLTILTRSWSFVFFLSTLYYLRQLLKEASLVKYFSFLCFGTENEWLHLQEIITGYFHMVAVANNTLTMQRVLFEKWLLLHLKKKLRLCGTWNYTAILEGFAFGSKPEQSLNIYKFSLQPFILIHYRARYFFFTWHLKISQSFNE